MKIAAILGVKDEIELIESCLAHLRAIGVDSIIAIDAGSTDGSWEALHEQRNAELQIHQLSDQDPDGHAWGRLCSKLARESDADWVFFLDADEFWIPASGSLKACADLAVSDLLRVNRFNVPLGPTGIMTPGSLLPCGYADVLAIVDPVPDFRARLEQDSEMPWIRGVPVPKVMVRPQRIKAVTEACHDVVGDGKPLRRRVPQDLFIAHFPFTTLSRFETKVQNVRKVFAVHDQYFGDRSAWHWRRWLGLKDPESIREEFERQRFSSETIAAYRNSGVIQSAGELFGPRAPRQTSPAKLVPPTGTTG